MLNFIQNSKVIFVTVLIYILQYVLCFAIDINNEELYNNTGQNVTIQVFAPGKSIDDLYGLSKGEYTKVIVFQQEMVINDEGKYNFEFELNGYPSGLYSAYIFEPDETLKRNVIYIDADENNTAVGLLNDESDIEKFTELLSANKDELGIHIPLYNKYEAASVTYIFDYVKNKNHPIPENDSVKLMNFISRASLSSALNSNDDLENIFVYDEFIDFSNTSIGEFYDKSFVTKTVEEDVTKRMKGKSISEDSFENVLTEAFVLAVVKNPDGYANVKDVLNTYYSKIGIKQNGKNSTYSALANEEFPSFAELKAKFEELEENTSGNTSGGGGGGGGSSGGSGNNGNISDSSNNFSSISTEIIQNQPAKDIPLEIFGDLDGHVWAKEAIISLAERNILNGKQDGIFAPGDYVTREEFTKMIVEAFYPDESGIDINFDDVDKSAWYYKYLCIASKLGVINGIDNNKFGTGQKITRQDMAVMIYRIASEYDSSLFVNKNTQPVFADDLYISDYAKEIVYTLRANDYISGIGNEMFAPLGSATRAEAAILLYNLLS